MKDSDIRAALHQTLLQPYHCDRDTLVVEELGLNHGSCRADIAIVNQQLIGVEIKSNNDSLLRLHKQARLYDTVFDSVFAVVGSRHESVIEDYLPPHWGIVIARIQGTHSICLTKRRDSIANHATSPFAVAELLWRSEALALLKIAKPQIDAQRLRRSAIYTHLVDSLPATALREEVRCCLRRRSNWRGRRQLSQCVDLCRRAAISTDYLAELDVGRTYECNRSHRRNRSQESVLI
jgi:hypothetical protein